MPSRTARLSLGRRHRWLLTSPCRSILVTAPPIAFHLPHPTSLPAPTRHPLCPHICSPGPAWASSRDTPSRCPSLHREEPPRTALTVLKPAAAFHQQSPALQGQAVQLLSAWLDERRGPCSRMLPETRLYPTKTPCDGPRCIDRSEPASGDGKKKRTMTEFWLAPRLMRPMPTG